MGSSVALLACFFTLLLCSCMLASGHGYSSKSSIAPTKSFATYDLYQTGLGDPAAEAKTAADDHEESKKKDLNTKSTAVAMEEYAVCKTSVGVCAATRLSCPAACIEKFVHFGHGYGYGKGYGGGYGGGHVKGYGKGYGGGHGSGYGGGYGKGYGGGSAHGYGGGYGRGSGYGGGSVHWGGGSGGGSVHGGGGFFGGGSHHGGGGGYGGGSYHGGGGGYGGGGGWASACKYDCSSACKATC